MPIPLGVLAVAGAGGGVAAGNAYEHLETVIVGSGGQASVSFSNLNSSYGSTYQHLQIRAVVQSTRASSLDGLTMTFNSDTGNNYARHWLTGDGSSVTSSAASSTGFMLASYLPGTTNSTSWAPVIIDILDPFETSKNTTMRSLDGMKDANWALVDLRSGFWNNTAALTTITFDQEVGPSFSQYSRFSLYGMRSS